MTTRSHPPEPPQPALDTAATLAAYILSAVPVFWFG